jgi:hypothetical protein
LARLSQTRRREARASALRTRRKLLIPFALSLSKGETGLVASGGTVRSSKPPRCATDAREGAARPYGAAISPDVQAIPPRRSRTTSHRTVVPEAGFRGLASSQDWVWAWSTSPAVTNQE